MLSGKRNKYKLSNANTAFIHQKHLKSLEGGRGGCWNKTFPGRKI